jgi:GDPmannose 4,6-dehydratase
VTRKIVNAAAKIRSGVAIKLNLGDLAVERDWGWAPEYVDAFVRMMERPTPGDYIIATGQTCSLRDFVKTAFDLAKLDWREHVLFDDHLRRPTDIPSIRLDPGKATRELGWTAKYKMQEVVQMMLDAEIEEIHHRKIAATLA